MVIIYGGSFNPPTKAHGLIVSEIQVRYPNAKIILLPVGNSYQKPDLIAFEKRVDMLKLMFQKEDLIISNFEDNNRYEGTLKSLKYFQKQYPNQRLMYVIGADLAYTLDTWIEYQTLLKTFTFIIINRNQQKIADIELKFKEIPHQFEWIEIDYPISSTEIRSNYQAHKRDLDPNVYEYIKKNKLYK